MRSVVVVFPASMCAMMPMFLQRSNGTVLGTTNSFWAPNLNCYVVVIPRRLLFSPKDLGARRANRSRVWRASLLPPVMRKRLVRFRHAMHIFFLLDGGAAAIGRVQQLIAQLVHHPLFATAPRITDDPADRQRGSPIGIHLDRHLIVRAAHAAGLHFEQRLGVLDSLLEQLQGFISAL